MALSDCYMLRDIQQLGNEQFMNVHFYQDLTFASTAEELVGAYIDGVIPKVLPIQTASIDHILVDAVNLADSSNFFEARILEEGSRTGETLPLFNAISFGLRLNSRALRPGSKRISGISETDQASGQLTGSTILGLVETLRLQFKSILLVGVIEVFQPIVVKRILYEVPDSSPVRTAYRLPENDGEFVFGNVIEVLTTINVRHQVSRGNGR